MAKNLKQERVSPAAGRIADRKLNALRDGHGGPFTKAQQADVDLIRRRTAGRQF